MTLLVNEALEAIVADDPYDDDRWSVLEDWLIEQGDPRAAISGADDPDAVRRELAPVLFGPEPRRVDESFHPLEWRQGFVRDARFSPPVFSPYPHDQGRTMLMVTRAPAARLLRSLEISATFSQLVDIYPRLRATPLVRTLRRLVLQTSGSHREPARLEAAVLDRYARLERLRLHHLYFDTTNGLVFANLHAFSIAPRANDQDVLPGFLCARPLPALRELELDFEHLEAHHAIPLHGLDPLWHGEITPNLQRLIVRGANAAAVDKILAKLANGPLTARLRELRLGQRPCDSRLFGTAFARVELWLPPELCEGSDTI